MTLHYCAPALAAVRETHAQGFEVKPHTFELVMMYMRAGRGPYAPGFFPLLGQVLIRVIRVLPTPLGPSASSWRTTYRLHV